MWHLAFVSIHAVLATAAFASGAFAILVGTIPAVRRTAVLRVHLWCTVGMSAALPLSIAAGWTSSTLPERPIYIGLFALSAYMVRRAHAARRDWRDRSRHLIVDHVGFNLIALATGFFAVAAIRADLGIIGIITVAAGIPALGHIALRRLRSRRDDWAGSVAFAERS